MRKSWSFRASPLGAKPLSPHVSLRVKPRGFHFVSRPNGCQSLTTFEICTGCTKARICMYLCRWNISLATLHSGMGLFKASTHLAWWPRELYKKLPSKTLIPNVRVIIVHNMLTVECADILSLWMTSSFSASLSWNKKVCCSAAVDLLNHLNVSAWRCLGNYRQSVLSVFGCRQNATVRVCTMGTPEPHGHLFKLVYNATQPKQYLPCYLCMTL